MVGVLEELEYSELRFGGDQASVPPLREPKEKASARFGRDDRGLSQSDSEAV